MAASCFSWEACCLCRMGVLGEYLGRVYDEVRSRPLSIISQVSTVLNMPHELCKPASIGMTQRWPYGSNAASRDNG